MGQKILIIKIGAIGDAVMALPALIQIRKNDPLCQITWVGGSLLQELIETLRVVDQFIPVKEKELYNSNPLKKGITLGRVWKKLFFQKFHKVYIFHHDKRYRVLSWFCRAQKRVCTTRDKYLKADQYHAFGYLKALGSLSYPFSKEVEYPKLPSIDAPSFMPKEYGRQETILLFPGGAKNTLREQALRRWPISYYVSLAEKLLADGLKVAVVGSEGDRWISEHFSHLPIFLWIGRHSLVELCQLIQQSALFVTHDTGPFHLAKLTSTPTLALFGPVSPYSRCSEATKNNNVSVIWGGENLPCRPCYDGKDFAPCSSNLCMQSIRPEKVYTKIRELLQKNVRAFLRG